MIEINLLPPEMRKVDRTSLKRLMGMVASVVLVSASVIGLALTIKAYRAEVAASVAATAEVARLEPLAKEYDVLAAEVKNSETRIQTIDDIRATRMRWAMKLDQLYTILPEYVWFEKVTLKKLRAVSAAQRGQTSTLVMDCYLAGADEKRYSEFRRLLTGELAGDGPYTGVEFFTDFASLGYSGWSREDFQSTEEGVALKFTLELPVNQTVQTAPAPKPPARPVVAGK